MGALRPGCPAGEYRALVWPQESNIDRKINKCWLRVVFRNVRVDLRFSMSSTVDMDSSTTWTEMHPPHTLCYIFSWFHTLLAFQSCIWSYDWLRPYFYRMLWKIPQQIPQEPIHGYWHHIFTSETTRNEVTRLKLLKSWWSDGIMV